MVSVTKGRTTWPKYIRVSFEPVRAQEPIGFSLVFSFLTCSKRQSRRTLCVVRVRNQQQRARARLVQREERIEEDAHLGSSRHSYLKAETDSICGGFLCGSWGSSTSFSLSTCLSSLFEQSAFVSI